MEASSFAGFGSKRTIVIYRLDPTGTIPIEPILDLLPGITGNRVTFDVIESENYSQTYEVTTDALQDFTFATSNIRRVPRVMSVTGFLTAQLQVNAGLNHVPAGGSIPASDFFRFDQIRLQNLKMLADARMPVAIYTPRHAFPKCAITNIDCPWTPDVGKNTRITISFMEINVVSPLLGAFVQDFDASLVGNNATSGGGLQSAQPAFPSIETVPGPYL